MVRDPRPVGAAAAAVLGTAFGVAAGIAPPQPAAAPPQQAPAAPQPPPVAPAPAAASNSTFAAFDTDGDGTISSPELHRVFEAGDRNANGSLSVMETRRSLKGMGLGIDNEVMSEFHSADTNEDGELQYDEFKRLVGHLTDDESLKA